jgi:hypothetical protein
MIGGFAMEICRKCSIVYENRTCPLCNLREHDNLVHDFIESKGRSLVRELVAYLQHRKTAADSGAGANNTQQTNGGASLNEYTSPLVNRCKKFAPL